MGTGLIPPPGRVPPGSALSSGATQPMRPCVPFGGTFVSTVRCRAPASDQGMAEPVIDGRFTCCHRSWQGDQGHPHCSNGCLARSIIQITEHTVAINRFNLKTLIRFGTGAEFPATRPSDRATGAFPRALQLVLPTMGPARLFPGYREFLFTERNFLVYRDSPGRRVLCGERGKEADRRGSPRRSVYFAPGCAVRRWPA